MTEKQSAHNGLVGGSSPSGPTSDFQSNCSALNRLPSQIVGGEFRDTQRKTQRYEHPAISLAPCTVSEAIRVIREWHRHLPRLQGGMFAAKCVDLMGATVGVAVAGNPSRVWQGTGRICITRVATDGAENACSMLYGALARAAKALGYFEVWTYTLPAEPGTSLRTAGFQDMGLTDGGEWSRPSRARAAAVRPEPKRRWVRALSPAPLLQPFMVSV